MNRLLVILAAIACLWLAAAALTPTAAGWLDGKEQ